MSVSGENIYSRHGMWGMAVYHLKHTYTHIHIRIHTYIHTHIKAQNTHKHTHMHTHTLAHMRTRVRTHTSWNVSWVFWETPVHCITTKGTLHHTALINVKTY